MSNNCNCGRLNSREKFGSNPEFCSAGRVEGNSTRNLCEKTSVDVRKVFDAAILEHANQRITVSVQGVPSGNLTFESAAPTTTDASVSDLNITRLPNCPEFARVSGVATVPLEVFYRDSSGNQGSGFSALSESFDLILNVPESGLMPTMVVVSENFCSVSGSYNAVEQMFTINGCADLIIKIECDALLLIPCYGYTFIPKAVLFEENPCAGFESTPLYPFQNPAAAVKNANNVSPANISADFGTRCKRR